MAVRQQVYLGGYRPGGGGGGGGGFAEYMAILTA